MTMDADGQHSGGDIPGFFEALAGYSEEDIRRWGIVIGSRFGSKEQIPRYRYYPNRVGQWFMGRLTGQLMEDTQSGFRLYRSEALQRVTLRTDRFELEMEAILKIARAGYRIHFVPIKTIYPEDEFKKTNFRPIRDTFRISLVVLGEIMGIR
jgi:hypothetical protein